jgi:Ca2+-binding RTX toxin-like protein
MNPTDSVTVNLGSGTDRVFSDFLGSNMHLNGGSGFDTLASLSAQFGKLPASYANINNFSAIEVTDTLVNNVNLDAFAPQNDITLVTLDAGYAGNQTVTGLDSGDTVALLSGQQAGGSELFLILDNALVNTNDLLNLKLSGDVFHGTTDFGTIDLNPGSGAVENVNLDSTTHNSGFVNKVVLEAPGIQNLTIQHDAAGDVSLRLDGSDLGGSVTGSLNVQAVGFTGAITDTSQIGGNGENVTFNAPNSGSDSLIFGNGNDSVTLGNGNNFVQVGGGNDSITAGNGNNHIVVLNSTLGNLDTISLGSGANLVDLNGTQGSGSTITFAAHGANVDQVNFHNTGESDFTLPDVITGFAQGHDVLSFNGIDNNAGHYTYQEVNGAVAVTAAIAGDAAGKHDIVLDKLSGNVYIDWNGNHVLSTADPDMQITLTGVNHLSLAGTTLV